MTHEQQLADSCIINDLSKLYAPLDISEASSTMQQQQSSAQLLAQRVLSLAEFRTELKLKQSLPKVKSTSTTPAPIPVPLSPGETQREYERRFLKWLQRKSLALKDLQSDPMKMRNYRFAYANQRAEGIANRPVFWKSQPSARHCYSASMPNMPVATVHQPQPTRKACDLKLPDRDAGPAALIRAYASCYCDQCVRRWLTLLTTRIETLEMRVLELTSDTTSTASAPDAVQNGAAVALQPDAGSQITADWEVIPAKSSALSDSSALNTDPFKQQMTAQYMALSTTINASETTMREMRDRPATTAALSDVERTLSDRAETEQLRDSRNAVVAAFVVYCWADKQAELRDKIARASAIDSPLDLQYALHAKCAALLAHLLTQGAELTRLKQRMRDAASSGVAHDAVNDCASEMQALRAQIQAIEAALTTLEDACAAAFMELFERSVQIRSLAKTMLERL